MVNVTHRAKAALKSALSASVEAPGVGLRLDVSEQGEFALYPDREKAGDQIVEHEGDVLLMVGETLSEPLDGATIDFTETPEGARLIVTRQEFPADEA
jgi:Fe-S cluster assembly iron-binding protein IscA